MVASLANYNFWLYYRASKTNIDADALLRVSWPGCMPDNSGTHLQVKAAAVQAMQEAALKGPTSPIRGIHLQSTCPGLNTGQSAGHLHVHRRLVPDSAGRSNPEPSYCKTVGWNPGVTTVKTE